MKIILAFYYRYASRVKLITNDASKNAENKEINRLKNASIFCLLFQSLVHVPVYTCITRHPINKMANVSMYCPILQCVRHLGIIGFPDNEKFSQILSVC